MRDWAPPTVTPDAPIIPSGPERTEASAIWPHHPGTIGSSQPNIAISPETEVAHRTQIKNGLIPATTPTVDDVCEWLAGRLTLDEV